MSSSRFALNLVIDPAAIRNPALRTVLRDLGLAPEAWAVLPLVPLLHVAWIDGEVQRRERKLLLEFASVNGVVEGPAMACFIEMLEQPPPDGLLEAAISVVRQHLKRMAPGRAAATIDGLIRLARQIADADGGFLGLFGRVSDKEDEAVAELAGRLRADATMTLPPAAALLASLDEAAAAPEPVQLLPTAETPATRVLLGSPPAEAGRFSNEGPQVEARISALFVDKVPVTQRLYRDVIGQNPSYRVNDLAPVTEVSWLDALLYCNRLSTVAGLTPCYAIDESEVAWTRGADGYRLPTEAEWEAVARAGTTGAYACAADPAVVAEHAWFGRGLSEGPYPVAEKHPNPWGLYDVHGNVWEWCWDVYAEGPAASSASACGLGGLRTARGGCYFDPLRMARSASRYAFSWSERSSRLGFRCVRDRR